MSEDQLQPSDTLDDRGVDDVLDEGYSPPDREPARLRHPHEVDEPETLDERLAEEEPDVSADRDGDDDADTFRTTPRTRSATGAPADWSRRTRVRARTTTPSCGPPTRASTARAPAPRRPRCTSSTRTTRSTTELCSHGENSSTDVGSLMTSPVT